MFYHDIQTIADRGYIEVYLLGRRYVGHTRIDCEALTVILGKGHFQKSKLRHASIQCGKKWVVTIRIVPNPYDKTSK